MGFREILLIVFIIGFVIAAAHTLGPFHEDTEDEPFSEFYE